MLFKYELKSHSSFVLIMTCAYKMHSGQLVNISVFKYPKKRKYIFKKWHLKLCDKYWTMTRNITLISVKQFSLEFAVSSFLSFVDSLISNIYSRKFSFLNFTLFNVLMSILLMSVMWANISSCCWSADIPKTYNLNTCHKHRMKWLSYVSECDYFRFVSSCNH